jgi:hypothetical protein
MYKSNGFLELTIGYFMAVLSVLALLATGSLLANY